MYKHIALIALLLPFSGYAITKQERREEILKEAQQIEADMAYLEEVVKHNFWIMLISPDHIQKTARDAKERIAVLNAEFDKITKELEEERHA